MKHTITISEINKMKCDTFSLQDNSPRGCKTVSKSELKIGDKVVIDNYFHTIIEDVEFISVTDRLPETNSQAHVYMKTANGRRTKGMFYMNGDTPIFAAYGSQIDNVTEWAYMGAKV